MKAAVVWWPTFSGPCLRHCMPALLSSEAEVSSSNPRSLMVNGTEIMVRCGFETVYFRNKTALACFAKKWWCKLVNWFPLVETVIQSSRDEMMKLCHRKNIFLFLAFECHAFPVEKAPWKNSCKSLLNKCQILNSYFLFSCKRHAQSFQYTSWSLK